MKVGAYQFEVTGDIQKNCEHLEKAIYLAAQQGIRLLVFPECALTGYPPIKLSSLDTIDFHVVSECLNRFKSLSHQHNLYLLVGSVLKEGNVFYNGLVFFAPDENLYTPYYKRALWGWDKDNFAAGKNIGIYSVDDLRIGVRICFEVRFPEYFRELFRAETDLNIVSFGDVADKDDSERYDLIKSHLRTRAVENVCPILSVNDIAPFQTAPTAYIDENGKITAELPRNEEKLLVYDFEFSTPSFGAKGRSTISKQLA
jgi:omega-amidase